MEENKPKLVIDQETKDFLERQEAEFWWGKPGAGVLQQTDSIEEYEKMPFVMDMDALPKMTEEEFFKYQEARGLQVMEKVTMEAIKKVVDDMYAGNAVQVPINLRMNASTLEYFHNEMLKAIGIMGIPESRAGAIIEGTMGTHKEGSLEDIFYNPEKYDLPKLSEKWDDEAIERLPPFVDPNQPKLSDYGEKE